MLCFIHVRSTCFYVIFLSGLECAFFLTVMTRLNLTIMWKFNKTNKASELDWNVFIFVYHPHDHYCWNLQDKYSNSFLYSQALCYVFLYTVNGSCVNATVRLPQHLSWWMLPSCQNVQALSSFSISEFFNMRRSHSNPHSTWNMKYDKAAIFPAAAANWRITF